ncbi:hypothetical protein K474DRAFT_1604278 [Panus rudis PR-1116 ss-1]|nr:hypothetical protein K474DRAFT_1604278 [Panus rudis PR-1116 ss-1]
MATWIAEVRCAAFLLEEIGGKVEEEDIILMLTNGLPETYDNLVINLNATPEDTLTIDYVIQRLLNEESCQHGNNDDTNSSNDHALLAKAPKPRIPIEKITCFKCNKKGHYQSNCTEAETSTAGVAWSTSASQWEDTDVAF